ncbi:hypothetical protein [Erythrobacter litoralis]|nr:hypothetical protein [Erythrobacter litoralis]
MFRSRGGALAFTGITLISVATLVGTEEEDGALADSIAQIEQQGAQFRDQAGDLEQSAPVETAPSPEQVPQQPVATEFVPDDELIVDPTGFDPTPDPESLVGVEIVPLDPDAEDPTG